MVVPNLRRLVGQNDAVRTYRAAVEKAFRDRALDDHTRKGLRRSESQVIKGFGSNQVRCYIVDGRRQWDTEELQGAAELYVGTNGGHVLYVTEYVAGELSRWAVDFGDGDCRVLVPRHIFELITGVPRRTAQEIMAREGGKVGQKLYMWADDVAKYRIEGQWLWVLDGITSEPIQISVCRG